MMWIKKLILIISIVVIGILAVVFFQNNKNKDYAKITGSEELKEDNELRKIVEEYFYALNNKDEDTIKRLTVTEHVKLNLTNTKKIELLFIGKNKNLENESNENNKIFSIVYKADSPYLKKENVELIDFIKDEKTGKWKIDGIGH